MLAKDFQIIENKAIFSFIGELQKSNEPNKEKLKEYYTVAKTHFFDYLKTDDCEKHIFAIFMNNMLANAKYTRKADMDLIDRYLYTFREINPKITETETDLIKEALYFYSVFYKDETDKTAVIDNMISKYGVALTESDTSKLILYWYEQVLLSAFAKMPFYQPEFALDITERSEITVLEHNQIKAKLKGTGEVLWQ